MKRYSQPVQVIVSLLQRPFDVEWTENLLSWPHCNGQAKCWMHALDPWCWCLCSWCKFARALRRDGGEPGICRHCGDGTELYEDPTPNLCLMCKVAERT